MAPSNDPPSPNNPLPADSSSLSQLTNSVNQLSVNGSSPHDHPPPTEKNESPLPPTIVYSRPQLLALHDSPLVKPPPGMPDLKVWFGIENEQNLSKKESEPVTPNSARDRRFRRDAEDGDTTSRPSFRSTVSQPSQMGNFKHQSLRSTDRDRERDTDKERERDIRDREGQERLRHLSDKYDRDRLALPSSNLRSKDREAAPHLANSSSGRAGGQNQGSGSTVRRIEGRDGPKKKTGETSDDWRRGADLSRTLRDDRPDSTRRDERERARSKARDSSRARRDPSTSRKERDHDRDDRDRLPRDDHRRDQEYRRDRDRDVDRDIEQDDPRRWRDDGKRDERIAARRATERQTEREYRDKEKTRDRADPWDASAERRWSPADDRDGRYRRPARDRKPGTQDELKDDRREREKEKEPAWMETYVPNGSGSGILGGKGADSGLDGIQAWKKELKEKEQKEKASLKSEQETGDVASAVVQDSQTGAHPMDEIQLFKMLMKREEEKKKTENTGSSSSTKPLNINDTTLAHAIAVAGEVDAGVPIKTDGTSSAISAGPQPPLSILGSKPPPSSAMSSRIIAEHPDDRSKTPSSRLFPSPIPQDKAIQMAGPPGLDANISQFNPPPGSRLLAFGRSGMKSPGIANTSSSPTPGEIPPNSTPKVDVGRSGAFTPFDEQLRAQSAKDERTIPELNRHPSATHFAPLSGPGIGIEPLQDIGAGYPSGKGSRFAKFFDGKQREAALPSSKPQAPVGLVSSSPNTQLAQESRNFVNSSIGGGEQRTMDEIFAMLSNSTQGHRPNLPHGGPMSVNTNIPFPNSMQNGAPLLQQQGHSQQQLLPSSRLEALYDNRIDDRNFVPDGMVPGLRPAPPPRVRENLNMFPDEESPHFNGQRLSHNHQQRAMDVLYSGPSPPMFNQQLRGSGLPLQQGHYRGGPSPISNPHNTVGGVGQQRLPPGLANLGGRPPHDPSQFIGVPGLSAGPGVMPTNMSGPGGPPLQPFNNFDGPQGVNFAALQMRSSVPLHQLQNAASHHAMGGIGHHGNVDPRMPAHGQLSGIATRGLNPGFGAQQNLGGGQQPPINMRQPHLPSHVMPHMMAPHLQQQQLPPGPLNQPAHDLMALLLGGPQRE